MVNASRIIVIISDCVDAFPTLAVAVALVHWREWIETRIHRYESALSLLRILIRYPRLHHLSPISTEDVSRILAH